MNESHEIRFLVLHRMKIWILGSITSTRLLFNVIPTPTTPGNFDIIRLYIFCTNKILIIVAKYEILQNVLPKLGTLILDFWNPHIMRFELIGSSNLHNKIKGNVSRQGADTQLHIIIAFELVMVRSFTIQYTSPAPCPAKTYMYSSRAFCLVRFTNVTVYRILKSKKKKKK